MRLMSLALILLLPAFVSAQPLPGTQPLTAKGDLAKEMVEGIDRYLTRLTKTTVNERKPWPLDESSPAAREKSLQPYRDRLKKILGIVDQRLPAKLEYVGGPNAPALLAERPGYKIYAVRWPVLPGMYGEGLLLQPNHQPTSFVVTIPDADQTPEMLVGLEASHDATTRSTLWLANAGAMVLVPTLIDRDDKHSGNATLKRFTNQTHREFVYRMAYEMGRHVIGYEIQKVLALIDGFELENRRTNSVLSIAVYGHGEGGMLALYSAAVDPRIETTVVSGSFGPRHNLYAEPIYRNVWGLLRDFGDAELARMIAPRRLLVESMPVKVKPAPAARPNRSGAAPGTFPTPTGAEIKSEFERASAMLPSQPKENRVFDLIAENHDGSERLRVWNRHFEDLRDVLSPKVDLREKVKELRLVDASARQKRQFDEAVDFTQSLLGPAVRQRQERVWAKLDTSSLAGFQKSQEPIRNQFWEEIIGKLPAATKAMNPRTRLVYEEPKWKGYEVVLDLYDDVICYGILLVPNDIKPGEKRPTVVCQHGLEGRPTEIVNPKKKSAYYNSFGAELADRGFVVFAPQNPYIFENEFRQLVRKANPLQLSLYSFIVRQHERILEFLGTLPFVDATRIAYYGLSYGGKVAMRIPALLSGYCLSICSGDFNEWIWKNITLDWGSSYMFTKEYEMYEFDLGNSFNYAEMAALIAPRPFMVERGHADGVGLDEYVAFEYAKVRRLYAQLKIADRTEIEFFSGGHEIRGVGTFAFLHRHLKWPAPK